MNDLLYKIDKISFFSLGGFPADRLLRQFNEKTNCCNLGKSFYHDPQSNVY